MKEGNYTEIQHHKELIGELRHMARSQQKMVAIFLSIAESLAQTTPVTPKPVATVRDLGEDYDDMCG